MLAFISNDLPMSYFCNIWSWKYVRLLEIQKCVFTMLHLVGYINTVLSTMAFTSSCYNNSKLIIVLCYIFLQILNSNFVNYAVTHVC